MRQTLLVAALLALAACGSKTPEETPPDAGETPLPDAGTPTPPCEGEGTCTIDWLEPGPFPVRVDHHTTFIRTSGTQTFLYVVGGVTANSGAPEEVYAVVRRAPIRDDGGLGGWEDISPLAAPLAFHGMALTPERLYLVGGITRDMNGDLFTNSTAYVGDFEADGTLTWRTGGPFNQAALHPGLGALGDTLHVTGGSGTQMDPKSTVFSSTLLSDGRSGPWTAAPALPEPRSHHAVVVHDERLYLVGGITTGQAVLPDVLRSVHDAFGELTGWERVGELPNGAWTHAAFVKGGYLYVVGGGEGGPGMEQYVGRVRRAKLAEDGTLGAFEDLQDPIPVPRAHVHQTPVHENRIYSVGGRNPSFTSLDQVFIGTFIE